MSKRNKKEKLNPHTKRRYIWAYIFLLPQLLVFIGISLYPMVMSYVYSFYKWKGYGPLDNFVGFSNYISLFQDERFWRASLNTAIYVVGITIIGVGLAFVLAIILNDKKIRGKAIFRTIYFLPVVTTTAIIGIIMNNIFGHRGLVNSILQELHLIDSPINWMTDGVLAMIVLVIVGSWKGLGINMIYWLAGLQSIPVDLYDSAQIDGAGFWQTLRHVTLPLLKPILAVIVLLSIVNGMQVFDLVKTLTNGGPHFATETLDLYIYNYAFTSEHSPVARMGYASAAGVVLGLFTFIVSLLFGGSGYFASRRKKKKESIKAKERVVKS